MTSGGVIGQAWARGRSPVDDLIDALDVGRNDRVAEGSFVPRDVQEGSAAGAAGLQRVDDDLQRVAHGRGVDRDETRQTERARLRPRADG